MPTWPWSKKPINRDYPLSEPAFIVEPGDNHSSLGLKVIGSTPVVAAPPLKKLKPILPDEVTEFVTTMNEASVPALDRIAAIQRWLDRPIKKYPDPITIKNIDTVKSFVRAELEALSLPNQEPDERLSSLRRSFEQKCEQWGVEVANTRHDPSSGLRSFTLRNRDITEYVSHTGLFGELESILRSETSHEEKAAKIDAIQDSIEAAENAGRLNPWLESAKSNPLLLRLTEETLAACENLPDGDLESQLQELATRLSKSSKFAEDVQRHGAGADVRPVEWILRMKERNADEQGAAR